MRRSLFISLIFIIALHSSTVFANWYDGNIVIKTNGNLFKSGDQLRVEMMSLETIFVPFTYELTYSYYAPVKVIDEEGDISFKDELVTIRKERGPRIENLPAYRLIPIDNRFYFGESSIEGCYYLTLRLFASSDTDPVSTINSCVFFRDRKGSLCGQYLATPKRIYTDDWMTFDGLFLSSARYSVCFFDETNLLRHLEVCAYFTDKNTVSLSSPLLHGLLPNTREILLHDHINNISSTIGNLDLISSP